VLCLPEDGDLSLQHAGEFMCMDCIQLPSFFGVRGCVKVGNVHSKLNAQLAISSVKVGLQITIMK
jgi:hypothetical protein